MMYQDILLMFERLCNSVRGRVAGMARQDGRGYDGADPAEHDVGTGIGVQGQIDDGQISGKSDTSIQVHTVDGGQMCERVGNFVTNPAGQRNTNVHCHVEGQLEHDAGHARHDVGLDAEHSGHEVGGAGHDGNARHDVGLGAEHVGQEVGVLGMLAMMWDFL